MSIKLSDSIRVGQQKPLEDKYFNELVPYTSISQVNTLLPKAVRHIGLTVNINKEEYWYKDGIEDSNLVLKVSNTDALILKNQEQDGRLENLEGENANQYDIINFLHNSIQYEKTRNNIQDNALNNLEGIHYVWSPTNRTLTLYDREGTQLSQVSLVSLDNEGTDIRYNADTLSLELYNADNELLASIPVSSFVGSVGTQLQLNSNELQLKDSQGNVLSTVSFSVVNIPGLQTALDSKLDKGTYTGTAQDLKTEIDGKANSSHTHPISEVTNLQTTLDNKVDKVIGKQLSTEDYTTYEKNKLSGIQEGAEVNVNADWNATSGDAQILNLPSTFTPSLHTHSISEVDNLQNTLDGKEQKISTGTTSQYWRGDKTWQTLDKNAVGLSNVDNTSDANKPISNATQTALNNKQDVLTEDNLGQFMDLELTTKSTPTSGDTVLARDILTNKAVEIPIESLGGNVDTSNLVPYTGANKDVNIASNYFKTSKGFDFTKDADNYFKTYYSSSYNHLVFYSEDSSNDNFGYMFIEANPEIGFVVNIANGDGIYNSFHATESRTYSEKPFVSSEGFIKTGGTANQALTADGNVFDLTTKADLVGGKVPKAQSQPSTMVMNSSTYVITFTDATGAVQTIDLPLESLFKDANYNAETKSLIVTLDNGTTKSIPLTDLVDLPEIVLATTNPAVTPTTGQKVYFNTSLGKVWFNVSGAWVFGGNLISDTEKTNLSTAYNHSQTTGNPHNTTKSDIGLGNVPNLDTTNAVNNSHTHSNKSILDLITEPFTTSLKSLYDGVVTSINNLLLTGQRLITSGEIKKLSYTSGTNTGDETTSSIQTKRPLKTIEGQSLEGSGNIDLTKNDIGLGNVDNTSDLNKPISTATQTALDLKANDSDVVHKSGNETITGVKSFQGVVPEIKLVETTNNNSVSLRSNSVGSSGFGFYAKTGKKLFSFVPGISGEAKMVIGNVDFPSDSQLLVYGGSNGANIDARGSNSADESNLDLENSDWLTNPKSIGLSTFGDNFNMGGDILGYERKKSSVLRFSNDKSFITSLAPIKLGINNLEIGNINSTGIEAISFKKSLAPATNILLAGGGDISQASLPISTATQQALNNKLDKDGNAATATKLQTARTINGVSFDGSADITINAGTTYTAGTNISISGNQISVVDYPIFSGNVGIGTTTLGARLDVRAQGSLATDIVFRVRNSADTQNFLVVTGAGDVYNRGAKGNEFNTFFGEYSGINSTGGGNNAFGRYALASNTTGSFNSAFGNNVLQDNTTGYCNNAFGAQSLISNITGKGNNAFGYNALESNTEGNDNSAFGGVALGHNTTGNDNTAIGSNALQDNTTGNQNVALGYGALLSNTTGNQNVSLGVEAGRRLNDGDTSYNTISSNSIYLGYDTRAKANNETNQIVIGHSAIGNGSNSVTLGNDSITKTVLKGNVGIGGITGPSEKLDVNGKIKDSQGILKAQRTITITGNTTLSETHNGAVLNVTNTCTITIPTGLDANFQCVVFAKGSVIVTFVNGGVTVYAPSGLLLKTDKMASLICTSTNNYNLTGELATS